MNEHSFRFEFDSDGTLHQRGGREGWAEPTCAVCHEPIRYCLDMFSFTTGSDHALAHARCVWTKEAFDRERSKAPSL